MFKQKVGLVLGLALVFGLGFSGFPLLASAEETTVQTVPPVDKIKTEMKAERLADYGARVSLRLEMVLDRVSRLLLRVNSRIEKMKLAGRDMTEAEAKVKKAETAIEAARVAVSSFKVKLAAMTQEATPVSRESIKTLTKSTIDLVKTAHQAVVEVIRTIGLIAQTAEPKAVTPQSVTGSPTPIRANY